MADNRQNVEGKLLDVSEVALPEWDNPVFYGVRTVLLLSGVRTNKKVI